MLLVFQYGQPRIFYAMARDGLLPRVGREGAPEERASPHITTLITGLVVAVGALVADENEIYDLTNIGTLVGVRHRVHRRAGAALQGPDRPRPFRVPFVWPVTLDRRRRVPVRDVAVCRRRRGSGSAGGSRSASRSTSCTATATRRCGGARQLSDSVTLDAVTQ